MVNKVIVCILFLFVSLQSFAQDAIPPEDAFKTVDIIVGLEKIIKLDFVPYTGPGSLPANESLALVKFAPAKKEITITGLKAGETSLTVRDAAGDIKTRYLLKVTASDQSKVIIQLKELLSDVEGLEIGLKGDSVYVGGQIVVPSDIGKVVVILERDAFKDVLRLVELSPQTQLVIAKKMQDEIQKSSFQGVTVRVVNGSFWIEGVVGSQGESDKVEQIVKAYLPDQIQNLAKRMDAVQSLKKPPYELLLTINSKPKQEPVPKLFKISAQFVELTKAYSRVFGFSWAPLTGADNGTIAIGRGGTGGLTTSASNTLSATISNLFPKLNAAKAAGNARILSSGEMMIKEGIDATIMKATDTPFTMGNLDSTKTGNSRAGFTMKVKPTMLQEEKINLKLDLTVSTTVTAPPASPQTSSDSLNTEVIIKNNDSAAIGGMMSSSTTTNFDRPQSNTTTTSGTALFSFLKSKEYTTDRVQFVFFITPEVLDSASTGTNEVAKKFRKKGR